MTVLRETCPELTRAGGQLQNLQPSLCCQRVLSFKVHTVSVLQMFYSFCITSSITPLYTGPFFSCATVCSYRPLLHAVPLPLVCLLAVGRRGDAPALRVHPAVYVVGDVASGDPTHRTH